jgi:hypothetical protein
LKLLVVIVDKFVNKSDIHTSQRVAIDQAKKSQLSKQREILSSGGWGSLKGLDRREKRECPKLDPKLGIQLHKVGINTDGDRRARRIRERSKRWR